MKHRQISLVVVSVALAALLWGRTREVRTLSYYSPDAYVERANRFIRSGYLVADCGDGAVRLRARLEQAPEAEKAWYEDSFLAADVARFENDPEEFGWAFSIDESCRLRGVNPVVHRVRLPFADWSRWHGSILYGGGRSDALLRSRLRTITLRRPEVTVGARDQATTEVGTGEALVREGAVLLHFAGGPGEPAARVHHVGDRVVINNRVQRGRPREVWLTGHRLPVGRIAWMATGDWIRLRGERPTQTEETFVFIGGEVMEAASAVRLQNDRYQRWTDDVGLGRVMDPVRDRTFPFLDLVVDLIDAALRSVSVPTAPRPQRDFDLQLTVRRDLQQRLGAVFHGAVLDRRGAALPGIPCSAGLTVMDGKSGHLLALATYPAPEDLDSELPAGGRGRRRLLKNQNLILHPVGSAAKPFLFAAIADAHPFLLDLVIDPHAEEEKHRELLQCELPSGYQILAGHTRPLTFRRALEVSCNKYAVELAALALAASRGTDDASSATELLPSARGISWPRQRLESGVLIKERALDYAPEIGFFVHYDERSPEQEGGFGGAALR